MIANKIKEIIEQRKRSVEKEIHFLTDFEGNSSNKGRKPLSSFIKNDPGISIISEIKPASPTLGRIRKEIDVIKIAKEMEDSGVVGLSILTEPNFFKGSYENLKLAVENTRIPCLMKDFVVDEFQYKIAAKFRATNILIINTICNLEESYSKAIDYDLEPLIEIHELEEIKEIRHLFEIGLNPKLIGVNNRNLRTLEIDLNTAIQIIPKLKEEFGKEIQVISESGINTYEDIKSIIPYGVDAFLIGSSIMQSKNIKKKILELRGID